MLILLLNTLLLFSSTKGFANLKCSYFLGASKVSSALDNNDFRTNRTLWDYKAKFPDLIQNLQSLGPEGHWLDLGAGSGKAFVDYQQSFQGQAKMTGVVWSLPSFVPGLEVATYYSGRLFEEIPTQEIPQADIITDVMGVLSYTRDLSTSLNNALKLLKPEGRLYINGPLKKPKLQIVTQQNKVLDVFEFLRSVPGLELKATGRKDKQTS